MVVIIRLFDTYVSLAKVKIVTCDIIILLSFVYHVYTVTVFHIFQTIKGSFLLKLEPIYTVTHWVLSI